MAGVLETPGCRQYAVDTEAIVRGFYAPMDWITVPREEWQGAVSNVRQLWVDAGEALRYEQIERAQELIREANWLSCEGSLRTVCPEAIAAAAKQGRKVRSARRRSLRTALFHWPRLLVHDFKALELFAVCICLHTEIVRLFRVGAG